MKSCSFLRRKAQFELVEVFRDVLHQRVQLRKHPFVRHRQRGGQAGPDSPPVRFIITKRAAFHSLLAKLRLAFTFSSEKRMSLPGAGARHQRQAQRVRAVLVDDLQRVDAVAQRFGHLAALRVAHQAVDEHGIERGFVRIRSARRRSCGLTQNDDDVISRDQRVGWVEIFKVLGLFRPSQRGERPQGGLENQVSSVSSSWRDGACRTWGTR